MDIRPHFFVVILTIFLAHPLFAQKEAFSAYYLIKRQYENRGENDAHALPLLKATRMEFFIRNLLIN
jgi:hypothetical protein